MLGLEHWPTLHSLNMQVMTSSLLVNGLTEQCQVLTHFSKSAAFRVWKEQHFVSAQRHASV